MARSAVRLWTFQEIGVYREQAGLTRAELARTADVDRATLTRIELGRAARKETLIRLGNALNELHYLKKGQPIDVAKQLLPAEVVGVSFGEGAGPGGDE